MATKKEDTKAAEAAPVEDQPEVKDQTMAEVGQPAPKNDVIETMEPGHTYEDRVRAQAKARGLEVIPGQSLEMLLWRMQMASGSAVKTDEEQAEADKAKADSKAKVVK